MPNATRRLLGAVAASLTLAAAPAVLAQGAATKSDAHVKVEAKADKPGNDGKQVVTVTLAIDKGWHTYANPVGNKDLESVQTTVAVNAKAKPEVKVEYPAGNLHKDAVVGDYRIYEGKVAIKAVVQRAPGDTGPLEVVVKFQACDDKKCLLPATVKVPVQ